MKNLYYYLDGKTPVATDDIYKWSAEFHKNRIVEQTTIGDIKISTVFLGLDHNFNTDPSSKPILFETMIFGGLNNDFQKRYETWKQAVKGHKKACNLVIPFWNRENRNSFVWEFFKVSFVSIFLLIFAMFLIVIL